MRHGSHTRVAVACALSASLVVTTSISSAQEQRPAGGQSPNSVVVNTDEVLFDVVVRDNRGRLVNDLTASDFEVYEDGVRQETSSFQFVAPASGATSAASGAT